MVEGQEGSGTLLIQDLIEAPDVRTVIQLEDLTDPNLRRLIVETFVVTGEVLESLKSVLKGLSDLEGRGIFLKGHFGSGKSHFLSMLSLLMREQGAWAPLLAQEATLGPFAEKVKGHRFLVVDISLVHHRSSEFLEDVVLRAIFKELKNRTGRPPEGADTRHETFARIRSTMQGHGFAGMVLLIDELSEFLRSKPDARTFNEDIRFLQYLGEQASAFPLWVIASLQEWIEETGEIHQDTFSKIKDRYHVRISLGSAHIEELVSQRLIRHRHGAEDSIDKIFADVKAHFKTFPVARERFARLYPVHPATTSLLGRLKPLFSEHRGVVDFIHFRIKGDPERGIQGILDRPAHHLLTPDVIFDHFLDRIREKSETQAYVERVFSLYREEIPELFQDREQQEVALSVVKLLILFAISPVKIRYTVRHLAEMLLFRVTPMDSDINYRFMHDIVERMAGEGAHIRAERKADPLDNVYFIDLKADIAGLTRRRIRHLVAELFPEDRRLFGKLALMVDAPHLPLPGWVEHGRQQVQVRWQHTWREGSLRLRQLDEVSEADLEGMAEQWGREENDFFILVGTTLACDRQYEHVREKLLPSVRERHPGMFLFWVPAAPHDEDPWLRETLAAVLLLEKLERDPDESGKPVREHLQHLLENKKRQLTEIFSRSYFQGLLLMDERQVELSSYGHLSQEKFLEEFSHPLLGRRFPRNSRVHPFMDLPASTILSGILKDFFAAGMLQVDDRTDFTCRNVLEGVLKPMGLIRKKGNQYLLQVDPRRNELVGSFFDEIGGRQSESVEKLYWKFRKGVYGLLRPQFEILVIALLCAGHLIAFQGARRKGLEDLIRTGLKGVTSLGRGEILDEGLRLSIPEHPLIPEGLRKQPVTLAFQEELWSELKSAKAAALEDLRSLLSRIEWASAFQAFKNLPWDRCRRDIEAVIAQWDEVRVSLSSREGLERFLRAGLDEPALSERLRIVKEAQGFLALAERALFVYQYLSDPRLSLPGNEEYASLRKDREEVLSFYRPGGATSISAEALEEIFRKFQILQDAYIKFYADAHHRARAGEQFDAYENLSRSRHYGLLRRLDQIEMISVRHNRRSIDQGLSSVLNRRCLQSPQDHLQAQPVCPCGFQLGQSIPFKPVRELTREIEQGIVETLAAFQSPAIQEKLLPYLEGLDLVGKSEQAQSIRRLLDIGAGEEMEILERLDHALTPAVIQGINEAFRGKVVVVNRDLDELYRGLVHRKYTLSQVRNIIREWLRDEGIPEDTFVHFLGAGDKGSTGNRNEEFTSLLRHEAPHLDHFIREVDHRSLAQAALASLWAGQHRVERDKIVDLFPFLNRGSKEDASRIVKELCEPAATVRTARPELFESLVRDSEDDSSFTQSLWACLASSSAEEIFMGEKIFPGVLREAFERLLSLSPKSGSAQPAIADAGTVQAGDAFAERRAEMVSALEEHRLWSEKQALLQRPKSMESAGMDRWESFFVQAVSPVPWLVESLKGRLARIGMPAPPFMRDKEKEAGRILSELNRDFSRFYEQALPAWEQEGKPRPVMIQDIPYLLSRKRGVPDHNRVIYLLMDGMRWDLWEKIKKDFFARMPDRFRVVREGALWAHRPTTTSCQLPYLEQAFRDACPEKDLAELLWKISGIDERIHAEKGGLEHLFSSVIRYLDLELLHRLRDLPSRTLLVLFSDHGFVENPGFSRGDKYAADRYTHGGDTPFEVIVPWAWVMRL
jgi:Family of unknown function (DUF6079)